MLSTRMGRLILLLGFTSVLCKSYVIKSSTWQFKNHPIAYERASMVSDEGSATVVSSMKTPILLLNGFGVGSFHQHRLIEAMNKHECYNAEAREIFCIDYLGQGRSWPENCQDGLGEAEAGLRYCGSTWVQQIISFLDEVVIPSSPTGKVHIVGNSVGGHLSVFLAALRPDLVESICLLNATPVWGLNLPGWSGHLPAPLIPKLIGRYLFDRIRDLKTIQSFLDSVYVNSAAFDETLMKQIRSCTDGPGGHAAFASILWSPPVTVPLSNGNLGNFDQSLQSLDCDVLLLFGGNDPWCKPAFARKMLHNLSMRESHSVQRYVELSNVGHCPNHEAPNAVARVLSAWLESDHRQHLKLPDDVDVEESWGTTRVKVKQEGDIPLTFVDRLATSIV